MSIDRHAAERRRFARLLGIDGKLGSGLPIGTRSDASDESNEVGDTRRRTDEPDADDVRTPRDPTGTS
ncbi:hypothetical protein ACLI4Z_02080 [Natrialbaceae archaeon A-arb3/5]